MGTPHARPCLLSGVARPKEEELLVRRPPQGLHRHDPVGRHEHALLLEPRALVGHVHLPLAAAGSSRFELTTRCAPAARSLSSRGIVRM